jgi:hypothetical protein
MQIQIRNQYPLVYVAKSPEYIMRKSNIFVCQLLPKKNPENFVLFTDRTWLATVAGPIAKHPV